MQITSAGLWSHNNECVNDEIYIPQTETDAKIEEPLNVDGDGSPPLAAASWTNWISSVMRMVKSRFEFWKTDNDVLESQCEVYVGSERFKQVSDDATVKASKHAPLNRFFISPKESLRAAILHIGKKWHGRLSSFLRFARRILGGLWVRNI